MWNIESKSKSSNNNGKTTEVPPSEQNYTNPICQYSIAISDTR